MCGQCGKTLEVNEAKAGPTVQCPKCGHAIPVLFFGADDQAPASAAAPDDGGFLPSSAKKPASDVTSSKIEKSFGQPAASAAGPSATAKSAQPPQEEGFADQARKASFKKISVKCDSCQKELSVGYRLAGKKARCPKCGKNIEIPYPDNVDKLELEILRKAAAAETEVLTMTAEDYEAHDEPQPVARPPEKPKSKTTPWIKTSKGRMTLITGVLGIGVAVGILIALSQMNWTGLGDNSGPISDNPVSTVRDPHAVPPKTGSGVQPEPVTPQTPPVTSVNPLVRQPLKPALALKEAKADEFAGATFLPAMPGMIYWYVSVEIRAGDEILRFPNHGAGIVLKMAEGSYPSLGSPLPGAVLPRPASPAGLEVPAQAKQELILVFEVPRSADKGVLEIAGVGQCEVARPPAGTAAAKLDGNYSVLQFRNLRPMPRNGVMQALQETPKQTLTIKPSGEGYEFSIPEAGLRGTARPSGKNETWDLTVTNGADSLENCRLCLSGDGDLLTLYTAPDSRFSGLTYLREGKSLRKPPVLEQIAPARLSAQPPVKPKDPEPTRIKTIFDP
ncbi:MAG: hypothetical protein HZA50_11160 [Planctomycetes bacterium]|nr:hypothetical protein [Planctomycetota bacterium]